MRNRILAFMVLLGGFCLITGCSEAQTDSIHEGHQTEKSAPITKTIEPLPKDLATGQGLFTNNCARCHGPQGTGSQQGPPLVHKIYEPSHHADFAFQRAAAQGVRAHHWKFGNMPKIEGITQDEVAEVIRYVRWLQQQAGIF